MSLSYLYFNSTTYPHKQHLLDSFKESEALNLDEISTIEDKEIYIVELNELDKHVSKKLISLLEKKKNLFIYFIIPKNYTLSFFQLAFLLKAQAVIARTQDIEKIISKIKSNQKVFAQSTLEQYLGSIKAKTQNFIVFKNKSLFYVSEALLSSFNCGNIDSFDKEIMQPKGIYKLVENETSLSVDIKVSSNETKRYIFSSSSISQTDTIIYVDDAISADVPKSIVTASKPVFISSRVAFIEQLKESILQKNISDKNLSLLSINFIDVKKLLLTRDVVKVEEILREILLYIESTLQNKLVFAQFGHNFYVILFENKNFQEINAITQEFYSKLLGYIGRKEIELPIELHSFGLEFQELSKILTTLDKIANDEFKLDEAHAKYMQHFSNQNSTVNEKKLLDDAFKNKLQLKILNIYNGLVINTSAKILKITDSSVYISFESLQGVVLDLEKQTVLQSEYFFQDIYAEVKNIHLAKKIAILENFKFLKTNANARQYARVTTAIKIPATVNVRGRSFSATILDLSIKSFALQIKNIHGHPMVEAGKVNLTFNLPNKLSENGYIQIKIDVNVVMISPLDKNQYYKIICEIDQNSHNLDVILDYVYERQKELIVELKKISKLHA